LWPWVALGRCFELCTGLSGYDYFLQVSGRISLVMYGFVGIGTWVLGGLELAAKTLFVVGCVSCIKGVIYLVYLFLL